MQAFPAFLCVCVCVFGSGAFFRNPLVVCRLSVRSNSLVLVNKPLILDFVHANYTECQVRTNEHFWYILFQCLSLKQRNKHKMENSKHFAPHTIDWY